MACDERGQSFYIIIVFMFALVAIMLAVNWWNTRPQNKISIIGDPNLESGELSAGHSTKLTVEIKNMSDVYVAHNVSVTVTTSNPSVVYVVGAAQFTFDNISPYNTRLPEFEIMIAAENVTKGTYSVTISVSAENPFQGDSLVTTIRVI
jgi:hypothetical protein